MFESLEERAVFSVAPLDLPPGVQSLSLNFTKVEGIVGTDHAWEPATSMQWGAGRGLVGDVSGDGRDGVAPFAAQGMYFHMLPYIEQDNVYSALADLDANANAFQYPYCYEDLATALVNKTRSGGEVIPSEFFTDGRNDSAGFASQDMFGKFLPDVEQVNQLRLTECLISGFSSNLRGEAIDIIPLVQQPTPTGESHDAAFAELGSSTGDARWADPRQQQIIAILIGLRADRADDSRMTDVTDGTSNTLLARAPRQDVNDSYL